MENLNTLLEIANTVQQYVAQQGKTYAISQGKMLKDDMPEDVLQLLKSA